MPMTPDDWNRVVDRAFSSPNERDRNGEVANIVDGLFEIARALHRIANAMETSSKLPIEDASEF